MSINIRKSDNTVEKLDLAKILRWGNWAAENCPDVSLESVVNSAASAFYDILVLQILSTSDAESDANFSSL